MGCLAVANLTGHKAASNRWGVLGAASAAPFSFTVDIPLNRPCVSNRGFTWLRNLAPVAWVRLKATGFLRPEANRRTGGEEALQHEGQRLGLRRDKQERLAGGVQAGL